MTIGERTGAIALAALMASCRAAPAPAEIGPDRGGLTGAWTMEFALDSSRAQGVWSRARVAPVRGEFRTGLADTAGAYRGTMTVDFRPLLGRQMSCYEPGDIHVVLTRVDSLTWTIGFTPTAADCGFSASLRQSGDTLQGAWSETSFVGAVSEGRVRMVRQR